MFANVLYILNKSKLCIKFNKIYLVFVFGFFIQLNFLVVKFSSKMN